MLRRRCAALALLALPGEALRSQIRSADDTMSLESWREDMIRELKNDPRAAQLRQPHAEIKLQMKEKEDLGLRCKLTKWDDCKLADLTRGRVTSIAPGGETTCLAGEPYSFEVYPGQADKVVIHFEGGGGCWSKTTLDLGVCVDEVEQWTSNIGFFNSCEQGNHPFSGYTVVHVRYCSGDAHVGNITRPWKMTNRRNGLKHTVKQHGYFNSMSAFKWLKDNTVADLDTLVVTGSSAGAIASEIWAPQLLSMFRPKHSTVLVDSWAGVFPKNFEGTMLRDMGMCGLPWYRDVPALTSLIPKCRDGSLKLKDMVEQLLTAYPEVNMMHIVAKYDAVQRFFHDMLANTYNLNKVQAICGDRKGCSRADVPKDLLAKRTTTKEEFYRKVVEIEHAHLKHKNFRLYQIADDFHCYAAFTFGDCPAYSAMVRNLVPGWWGPRRDNLQREVLNVLSGDMSLASNICEDMQFEGARDCDASLNAVKYVPPGHKSKRGKRKSDSDLDFDWSGGRSRASPAAAGVMALLGAVLALAW